MIFRHGILSDIRVGVRLGLPRNYGKTFGRPIRSNDGIKTVSSITQFGCYTKILMLPCRIARSWRMETVETSDGSCCEDWDREEAGRRDLGSVMRFPRFCVYIRAKGRSREPSNRLGPKELWTLVFSVPYLICLSSRVLRRSRLKSAELVVFLLSLLYLWFKTSKRPIRLNRNY